MMLLDTSQKTLSVKSSWRGYLHYLLSGILVVLLVPLFGLRQLPLRFDWLNFLTTYWISLGIQSIFLASLLVLLLDGREDLFKSIWNRYWSKKPRLIILCVTFAESAWLVGLTMALVFFVVAMALIEFAARLRSRPEKWVEDCIAILIPAFYFFFGLILVFSYNDVIASFRFFGSFDPFFNNLDAVLLGGRTVAELAHAATRSLPLGVLEWAEFVYFRMFAQIGATLILIAVYLGRKAALRFVGTILTAYYLALICYLLTNLDILWYQGFKDQVSMDYFIAFPCMHIAQPMIALWWLRQRKPILVVMSIVNILLVISIVLLEWHYLVDILGGALVALCALWLIGGTEERRHLQRPETQVANQPEPLLTATEDLTKNLS
jgi:PAP2 superfamily